MTREEAIEYWEGLRKTFSSQLEKEENHFGRMHLQTTIDALDMAISAIRQQDVPDKDVGKNEPLTLDELRQMYDGEEGPVWLKVGTSRRSWPAILDMYDGELVAVFSATTDFFHENDYGKTWMAYRQKPEEDDHDERKENENV